MTTVQRWLTQEYNRSGTVFVHEKASESVNYKYEQLIYGYMYEFKYMHKNVRENFICMFVQDELTYLRCLTLKFSI